MTTQPIVKTVRVALSPAAAFDLFTAKFGNWWPAEPHSVSAGSGVPPRSVGMEPGEGGALFEIAHDGTRHIWGRIGEWSPGAALGFTWHPGKTEDRRTHVRVTFEPDGTGTRVTLTHSGWETLAPEDAATRTSYDTGWPFVLDRFARAA